MSHRNHHLKAIACWAAVVADIALLAWWFHAAEHLPYWHAGFCMFADATTRGGDCPLKGIGYLIVFLGLITAMPLFGLGLALFQSHFTTRNVHKALTPPQED